LNVEDLLKGDAERSGDDRNEPPSSPGKTDTNPRGRRPLPTHLKRQRIVHDLDEAEKHCAVCAQHLREFGEEISERYEYIPAQLVVIEDVCKSIPAPAP